MDDIKTPYDLWVDLKEMVAELEKDAIKATRGMKAGGVRLRSSLQDIREHCQNLRKCVLEHRSAPRKKGKDEIVDDLEVIEVGEPTVIGASASPVIPQEAYATAGSSNNGNNGVESYESLEALSGLHAFAHVNRAV